MAERIIKIVREFLSLDAAKAKAAAAEIEEQARSGDKRVLYYDGRTSSVFCC